MGLGLVKEVHGVYLLSILFFPNVHLLVIETDKTLNILIIENAFHLTSTCTMGFVLGYKVIAEFEGLW